MSLGTVLCRFGNGQPMGLIQNLALVSATGIMTLIGAMIPLAVVSYGQYR